MLLDHHQQAYSSAGFNATLRDLGRFGQMMAQGGRYNGQQIVPESWVNDIRTNGVDGGQGERDVGLAAPAPWPGHRRGTYRSFWWLTDASCGRFAGVGLGGQLLIVDPVADMVVVKFDSVPDGEIGRRHISDAVSGDRRGDPGRFRPRVLLTLGSLSTNSPFRCPNRSKCSERLRRDAQIDPALPRLSTVVGSPVSRPLASTQPDFPGRANSR